jgi:hypothetical protein
MKLSMVRAAMALMQAQGKHFWNVFTLKPPPPPDTSAGTISRAPRSWDSGGPGPGAMRNRKSQPKRRRFARGRTARRPSSAASVHARR